MLQIQRPDFVCSAVHRVLHLKKPQGRKKVAVEEGEPIKQLHNSLSSA
jgi:hypothetical protein